jgi:hypothetical protein
MANVQPGDLSEWIGAQVLSLLLDLAAVDLIYRSGCERGVIGEEERHSAGNLLRSPEAVHRGLARDRCEHLGGHAPLKMQ